MRRFENVVGAALFQRVTLLAAVSPFNRFSPTIPDLHGEFVKRVKGWLDRTATLSHQERDTRLGRLAALLQEEDALRRLFKFLVEA